MERPLSQEYINIIEEDRRCLTEVIDRARPGQVSSSVQDLTAYDLQLRKVITPSFELRFGVFLDSMEITLSQEYIHMPEEDIRC